MTLAYDLQSVVKRYPGQTQPANAEISLQIAKGEIFGLLGANGAGKTTLIRQMVNLLRSSSGSIRLFGQNIADDSLYVPTYVGYMPQESHALNNLTVAEALYYTAHLRGMARADAHQAAVAHMQRWQITELRDLYSTRLSGGQRRLLRLAVATVGLPPVCVLDEPTNDLDPQRRRQVWHVIQQLNQDHQCTIIFVTHDAIEAEKVIQRVGIMRAGRMVAVGRPADLKQQVDQQLRLELFFPPERPPCLPESMQPRQIDPGRWIVYIRRDQVAQVMQQLDLAQVDDLRLYSATLEDVYLHYATNTF